MSNLRTRLTLTEREASTMRHAVRLYLGLARNYLEQEACKRLLAKLDAAAPPATPPLSDMPKAMIAAAEAKPRTACLAESLYLDRPCTISARFMVLQRGTWTPVCTFHHKSIQRWTGATKSVPLHEWTEQPDPEPVAPVAPVEAITDVGKLSDDEALERRKGFLARRSWGG